MEITLNSWKAACQMMRKEGPRLQSYLQWYPFHLLPARSWQFLSSSEFYERYIKEASFVLVDSMRFVTDGIVQKEGASFRLTRLVSPVFYLYLLAYGLEYANGASLVGPRAEVFYAGNLKQRQAHYRQSYKVFCDCVNHCVEEFQYCLKTDISNFFGSINVDSLISSMQHDQEGFYTPLDAVAFKALLLYCGKGRYPVVQNHVALSYFATKVFLGPVDIALEGTIDDLGSIPSFRLVRYVDDLYVFFDVEASVSPYSIGQRIIGIYSDLLRQKGLAPNQSKCRFGKADAMRIAIMTPSIVDFSGEDSDAPVKVTPAKIALFFDEISLSIANGRYAEDDFSRAAEDAFGSSTSPVTAMQVFRNTLYKESGLFKDGIVVEAMNRCFQYGGMALVNHTEDMVRSLAATGDERLIKSFLNGLFGEYRSGGWSSVFSLAAITYLMQRHMRHNDLIRVLKMADPELYDFCRRYCLPDSKPFAASAREKRLVELLLGDEISKVQYSHYLYHRIVGNALEETSYYRSFFDRVSTMLKRLEKPKRGYVYKEKDLRDIYSKYEDADEIIRSSENLRQKNPLIHAEGAVLHRDVFVDDLRASTEGLQSLVDRYLDELE